VLGEEEVLKNDILYVYPRWHRVSFSLVAEKHVEYMRRVGVQVYEMDELAFHSFTPVVKYTLLLQPAVYTMHRALESRANVLGQVRPEYLEWWYNMFNGIVGFDVADSDRLSDLACRAVSGLDVLVVPSTFARGAWLNSCTGLDVRVIPHGLDPEWYSFGNIWETAPPSAIHPAVLELYLYKLRRRVKIVLFWLWHSPERKGWPEVREVYERLRRERGDVVLVLKTGSPRTREFMEVAHLGAIEVYGWLDEVSKMALYDLADVTLVLSRGGAFELNALESLARGVPAITTDYGGFTDYVPDFLRARRGERVPVLPGNAIHVGYGYKADVDDVLDKLHRVLDDAGEYRAKVLEWRDRVLRPRYRWDIIAGEIIEVVRGVSG
jgi:glycosyltransferase involved in cell wall biosynthesis